MTESRARYERLKELVTHARALAPDERRRYFDAACAGDTSLRREAEDLLAHDRSVDVLETAAFAALPPKDTGSPARIGRYEVQRRLGSGGMGALYLARDPQLDRLVAIKLLKEELQHDSTLRERFVREARSVARLRHSNIVIVYDVGEDDGRPFMAMEYLSGETLANMLRQRPSLPVTRRLSMIEDLCAGLAHAHSAGIIHRDIKPANIMLDGDGVLKILDFGIARLGNSAITQEGMVMGTVNYMSPEQVTGRGVDHRTDIFAAGAVLYESICLEQAFPVGIDGGVLHRILTEGPVPLNRLVPHIDQELLGIVQRALDRDPAQRYQDASVMRRDLLRVRRRLMDEGGGHLLDSPTAVETKAAPSSPYRRPDSDRPRRLHPARFAELQRQQVAEHLRFGEEAFARGEHDAALQHAERAATVDPDSREAFDLIDRARFAIETKAIRQLLAQAQRLLADGQLEDAAALADEAAMRFPGVHDVAELRGEVRLVVEEITSARDREQRIAASLERARSSIDRGVYKTALRAVYEVLSIDPNRPQAQALEVEAQSRLQAQREHESARRTSGRSDDATLLRHRVEIADERALIKQLIERYVAACNRLDEDELRRIDSGFKSLPSKALLESLELTLSGTAIDIDPGGQTATVTFTQHFRFQWNRPGMPPTESGPVKWSLRKMGNVWAVVQS